jgi:hypothetical protein
MVEAFLVIFSLDASGHGTIMVDVLPSMEICRQTVEYRRAQGETNSHCVPTAELVRLALELNQCEPVRDTLFACAERVK